MTPNDLDVLIHCYCRIGVHPRISAPAVKECIARFLEDGIIEETGDPNEYDTTEKGDAFMMKILRTTYPTKSEIKKHTKTYYKCR